MCSTPYGITATRTAVASCTANTAVWCSTPYGITATRTRDDRGLGLMFLLCSTPYGITATRTRDRRVAVGTLLVLNALRHHGDKDMAYRDIQLDADGECSTPYGITATRTTRRPNCDQ